MSEQLAIIKQTVRDSIRHHTRRGYIGYGDCDAICHDMAIALEDVERDELRRDPLFTFDVALFILITSMKLASTADSSSGYLTDVIFQSFNLLRGAITGIAASSDEKSQKKCFDKIVKESANKVFHGWTGWSYELLECSIALLTRRNLPTLDQALEVRSQEKDELNDRFAKSKQLVIRAKIIQKLDGYDAAKQFMYAHLNDDDVCELAVKIETIQGDYQEAEKLCHKKLSQKPYEYFSRPAVWRTLLFDIYQKSGDEDKLLETAKDLLLLGDTGRLDTIIALHTKRGDWEEVRPAFLQECASRLPVHYYLPILKRFEEWRSMIEIIRGQTAYVYDYADVLVKAYRPETLAIYASQIKNDASTAINRKQYRSVCRRIGKLMKLGGSVEAAALVHELKNTYQRKPAFIEELNNVL